MPVPPSPGLGGVEQVEVGVEALEVAAGRRREPIRTALITFAPVRRATAVAERRALVAVQLHVREAERVDGVRDLVERRVDEDADGLDLAAHARAMPAPPRRVRRAACDRARG